MRWVGHAESTVKEAHAMFELKSLMERQHLKELVIDQRVIG